MAHAGLEVNDKGPGETCELAAAGNVRIAATVESYVPFDRIEVIVNARWRRMRSSRRAIPVSRG